MTDQSLAISKTNLDVIKSGADAGLVQYLRDVQKMPYLTAQEEYDYGMKVKEKNDREAAKMLVQSHLRRVVKMAMKFKRYGLPTVDLISEGNLGLIHAVKKFDPTKGFRFATYAMWWIRAQLQEYVLRSWSLVKIGTTVAQKKLFFSLHKVRRKLELADEDEANLQKFISKDRVAKIAKELNVAEKDVIEMRSRLSQSDASLNQIIGDEESGEEMQNLIASNDPSQEEIAMQNQELSHREDLFSKAFANLNEREKDILTKRQLLEEPQTLEQLSEFYKVSRERIRQIEANAIHKIKKEIERLKRKKS